MTRKLPDIVTNSGLIWLQEIGVGYHPKEEIEYGEEYWEEYRRRDNSETGKLLSEARADFVLSFTSSGIVDIGIGGGAFVSKIDCFGYDINKKAIEWLGSRYLDPYLVNDKSINAITCWDSLEHIQEPEKLIEKVKNYVFVSIPIFKSGYHALKSKHFKPGEHVYYFTNNGLIDWFYRLGFDCIESNTMESDLGREGIYTYAFRRR